MPDHTTELCQTGASQSEWARGRVTSVYVVDYCPNRSCWGARASIMGRSFTFRCCLDVLLQVSRLQEIFHHEMKASTRFSVVPMTFMIITPLLLSLSEGCDLIGPGHLKSGRSRIIGSNFSYDLVRGVRMSGGRRSSCPLLDDPGWLGVWGPRRARAALDI